MNNGQQNGGRSYLEMAGLSRWGISMLMSNHYFEAPASKGHHLNCYGGLAMHSENVTRRLVELTNALHVEWPHPESPYLVGMLHDLVKCRCYDLESETPDGKPVWKYVQPEYPGHGACSVAIANELAFGLLPAEVVAITYHMGTYGIGREYTKEEYEAALSKYGPQILATHCADMWAARVDEDKGGEA